MAVPNEYDYPQISDRAQDSADRTQGNDLSANMWQEMKSQVKDSGAKRSNQNNEDVLEFNDIYACTNSAEPQKHLQNIKDIKDYAEKNFDSIDADKNGYLTAEELQKAKQDKCLTEDQKKALEILQTHQQGMSELSDDEFGFENDGITKADLKAFDQHYDEYKKAGDMSYYAVNDIGEIDKDSDGYMSAAELDQAIAASTDKTSEKHQALVRMREQYDELMGVSNDEWGTESKGLSWRDVAGNAINKSGGAGGFFDDPVLMVSMSNDLSEYQLEKRRPFVRQ